jgi:hypothetical protein
MEICLHLQQAPSGLPINASIVSPSGVGQRDRAVKLASSIGDSDRSTASTSLSADDVPQGHVGLLLSTVGVESGP